MSNFISNTKKIFYFFLLCLFFYSTLNLGSVKAATPRAPVLGKSTIAPGTYAVTFNWTNPNVGYNDVDPDAGKVLDILYKDGVQIYSVTNTQSAGKTYSYTATFDKNSIKTNHTFYVNTIVTKPASKSPNSNVITLTPKDFSGGSTAVVVNTANAMAAPKLTSTLTGTNFKLIWSRTDYNDCDPDGGYIGYKIIRDGVQLATAALNTTFYTDTLSKDAATKSHTYYVKTYCTRTINGTGKESANSNAVKYTPATGTEKAKTESADGVIVTAADVKADSVADGSVAATDAGGGTTCNKACDKPEWWNLSFQANMRNTLCQMQCGIIDWYASMIKLLFDNILIKAIL